MSGPPGAGVGDGIPDVDVLRETLGEHPVELAVLFGSTATGDATAESDLDLAVEFVEDVDRSADAVMELLVDLSVALDRNDIDLSVVGDLDPRVGLAAFEHGRILVGNPERAAELRDEFERKLEERETEPLRQRLDDAIERVDSHLEEAE